MSANVLVPLNDERHHRWHCWELHGGMPHSLQGCTPDGVDPTEMSFVETVETVHGICHILWSPPIEPTSVSNKTPLRAIRREEIRLPLPTWDIRSPLLLSIWQAIPPFSCCSGGSCSDLRKKGRLLCCQLRCVRLQVLPRNVRDSSKKEDRNVMSFWI